MTSLIFNYLFSIGIPLMMLISGIYILKTNGYSKFERIIAKVIIPSSLLIILYIFIFGEGLTKKIESYKEFQKLKPIEVDSIIYKSNFDKIKIINPKVIENLINHYNEMESTLMIDSRGSYYSFHIIIYTKKYKVNLEHYYNSIGKLVISVGGGYYYSEGLGYYMTKEYLSTPVDVLPK